MTESQRCAIDSVLGSCEKSQSLAYLRQALGLAERLEDHQLQSWCCNGLGDVYADVGDCEGAIATYRRALTFDPTSAYAYLGIGTVSGWLLGRHEEASDGLAPGSPAAGGFDEQIQTAGCRSHLSAPLRLGSSAPAAQHRVRGRQVRLGRGDVEGGESITRAAIRECREAVLLFTHQGAAAPNHSNAFALPG